MQVQDLWEWYTDFRSDDDAILMREGVRGARKFLYRNVSREGDRIHIDQAIPVRKRKFEVVLDITLHPENLTYDTAGGVKGFLRETRHYAFTQSPEGASVKASVTPEPLTLLGRLFGLRARGRGQRAMDGFLHAAEKELSSQPKP